MSIRSWLEKRKRKPKLILPGLACPGFTREMRRIAPEVQQRQQFEALFGEFGGYNSQHQAYQRMGDFNTMSDREFLAFASAAGGASPCQPHRASDPSICNTVSPKERKHVDSIEVPQKCLP